MQHVELRLRPKRTSNSADPVYLRDAPTDLVSIVSSFISVMQTDGAVVPRSILVRVIGVRTIGFTSGVTLSTAFWI